MDPNRIIAWVTLAIGGFVGETGTLALAGDQAGAVSIARQAGTTEPADVNTEEPVPAEPARGDQARERN